MATNANAPYGFREIGLLDGYQPNFGIRTGRIASANLNKIFFGDVLKPLAGGYYDVAAVTPGGGPVGGVAVGFFSWYSKSAGQQVWRPYWPGNGDASGDIIVKVNANPGQLFEVQCLLGPIGITKMGQTANFNVGAGGQQFGGGLSSFTLDDGTLSSANPSNPFKVYSVPGASTTNTLVNLPGSDPTQPYNSVYVTFNNLVA